MITSFPYLQQVAMIPIIQQINILSIGKARSEIKYFSPQSEDD